MRLNNGVHHARRAEGPRVLSWATSLKIFVIIFAFILLWKLWFLPKVQAHEYSGDDRVNERAKELKVNIPGLGTSTDAGELSVRIWNHRISNYTGEVGLNGTCLVEEIDDEETCADEDYHAKFWLLHKVHQVHLCSGYYCVNECAKEQPVNIGVRRTSTDAGELLRLIWNLRICNQTCEVRLNGTDLVDADENLRDRTEEEDDEDEDEESAEGYLNGIRLMRRSFRSFRAKKGKGSAKVQQNEANLLTVKRVQKLKSVRSQVKLGAVIPKSVDKQCEVFWDNDENGFQEHGSAVARSNIQVDIVVKENEITVTVRTWKRANRNIVLCKMILRSKD